jgi:hypothetical protein
MLRHWNLCLIFSRCNSRPLPQAGLLKIVLCGKLCYQIFRRNKEKNMTLKKPFAIKMIEWITTPNMTSQNYLWLQKYYRNRQRNPKTNCFIHKPICHHENVKKSCEKHKNGIDFAQRWQLMENKKDDSIPHHFNG